MPDSLASRGMLVALLLSAVSIQAAPDTASPDCSYDLGAMLALDRDAFDQDMQGGWRILARREGCEEAAAELIREWRTEKRDHTPILYWHEGQMRAFAGQDQQAVDLFALTYRPARSDTAFGWNHYVDGSIAFLERDLEGLQEAIGRLRSVERPDVTMTGPDGSPVKIDWPPNLRVLEAFERCWDRGYAQAYGNSDCREPGA